MAFEADCGVSTVLEAFCVTSTAGFLEPAGCRATCGPRDEVLRDSATATGGSEWKVEVGVRNSKLKTHNSKLPAGVAGRQIRNSKFEIRNFLCLLYARMHRHGRRRSEP